ncbi:MAG: TAT-variant-translocated molybdopterin oxidoreductase [Acidobacteria bacterium]|nr:TAT-variant-translocated molybdopterin oxidoreductase [Acidobacteriota bacterium]
MNDWNNVQIRPAAACGGDERIDLAALQSKLESSNDSRSRFWRSLDELADTQRYEEFTHAEFPEEAETAPSGVSRRQMLKLMGASAALAGLTACTKLPAQKIVPYVRAPEEIIPGKPLFYATAMPQGGVGMGLLVESHMGRPTKIEGNPDHPASLGATNIFAQAAILSLYDPDRSQVVLQGGRISSCDLFTAALRQARDHHRAAQGAGLRILTETVTSPTLASQIEAVFASMPEAKWHQYEPGGRDAERGGAQLAFGEYVNTFCRFDRADVILSLDSDFLASGPASVRYARDFTSRRHIETPRSEMNRLYVAESTPSNTGAMADHRIPLRARDIEAFARAVSAELGVASGQSGANDLPKKWIAAVARDLKQHRGRSIVVAGEVQPPAVHALAHAMNDALGNLGATVICTDPIEPKPTNQVASLRDLVSDMKDGRVKTLLILGGNPAYTAPADLEFSKHLLNVPLRAHLSLYQDETSQLCHWHIPEAHFLESWSDLRAYDGTVSILQPLISPLYDGKTAHDLLAVLEAKEYGSHDAVKAYWKGRYTADHKNDAGFESFWDKSLHDGFVGGSALPEKRVSVKNAVSFTASAQPAADALELIVRPDPTIGDGRWANNAWLQELPKPLTQLTWDNAALMSPKTAQRLGVTNEDVVILSYGGKQVKAPVWLMPGHADESVTVHLGYGRARAGNVGTGIGFNASQFRTSQAPWFGSGLKIQKTGDRYPLATTQFHHVMQQEGRTEDEPSVAAFERELVRVGTLEEFRKNPDFAKNPENRTTKALSLYPGYDYRGYAWGMAIDMNRCIGCNACVVACQAENNIPVVGKEEVRRGREMHWIRVDTYFRGGLENPETYHQPVVCMQCENAPCEVVCPVGATVHTSEGLNDMVYNRCVGTRYCSNNCPYKVRHFNFKMYSDWETPSLKLLRNPNVTVRSRGVMEKCTYCVQRINSAKIEAGKKDRPVRDGEIATACEAACPAQAIVFGNINDPGSRVAKLKAQSRNFALLTELNTKPRTSYLAKLRNPNPEIEG